jgi:hypothetical protein
MQLAHVMVVYQEYHILLAHTCALKSLLSISLKFLNHLILTKSLVQILPPSPPSLSTPPPSRRTDAPARRPQPNGPHAAEKDHQGERRKGQISLRTTYEPTGAAIHRGCRWIWPAAPHTLICNIILHITPLSKYNRFNL